MLDILEQEVYEAFLILVLLLSNYEKVKFHSACTKKNKDQLVTKFFLKF